MNKIENILLNRLINGDEKLISLFESYVKNMGHTQKEAKHIVESIISTDKKILREGLSDLARFK